MSATNDFGINLNATLNTKDVPKQLSNLQAELVKSSSSKVKIPIDIDTGKIIKDIDKLRDKVRENKVDWKNWFKEISTYKDQLGNTFKDVKIFDLQGNIKDEEIKQVTSSIKNLTTETHKWVDSKGDINTWKTTIDQTGKTVSERTKEIVNDMGEITTITQRLVSEGAGKPFKKMGDDITQVSELLKETTISTSTSVGQITDTINGVTKTFDGTITTMKKMSSNGEELTTVISKYTNDLGQAIEKTETFNKAGVQVATTMRKISDIPKTKDTGTTTFINKDGVKTVTQYVSGIATLRTETKQYTTSLGALIKEVKVYDEQTHKLISTHREEINDQKTILDNIEKEKQARIALNKAFNTTTTTSTKGKITQFGSNDTTQYDALITKIEKVNDANEKVITTTYEFINAQGQLVTQTRTVNENNEKLVADEIKIDGATKRATTSINNLNSATKSATNSQKTFGEALNDALARLTRYYIASLPIQAFRKGITEAIETIKEFDNALIEFRKVSDLTGESLDNYIIKLAEMGKVTGSTMQAMVEASTEFRKSGFSDEDSAKLASVAEKYRNIADEEISAGESASFIIAQMKAFNVEASDAEHIIDSVNEVANNFSVSSADLATNLGNMSAIMAINNVSMEEQIGMLTGVTEITRNASSASRGLVMISSRLTQVLDDTSSTGKKLTAIYDKLDIELKDSNGQLRSHFDILGDLAEKWDSLSENEQKYIALTSAGARQQQNFVALMENWSQVAEATETAYKSMGSAQRENEKVMDSIEKKTEILRSEFQQLVIGKGGLTELAKSFLDVATAALKFINALGGLTPLLVTLTGILVTIKADSIVLGLEKFGTSATNLISTLSTLIPLFRDGRSMGMSFGDALKYAGVSASVAQVALGALTAVISIAVIAFKKYQQQQEENHRKAKESLKDYENYIDNLSETLKKIESEQTTKKDLIEINKKLNKSYDEEKAQLKDINDLREENIKLLYKENKEKAQETVRETASEAEKAKRYLTSDVKGTDLGGYNIKRNTIADTLAYESIMKSTVGKSRAEQLDIVGKAIDKYNEKVSNNIELSKFESLTLQQLTITYDALKEKYDDATNTLNTYEQAVNTLRQSEEEFVNTLRVKTEEQGVSTELTIEEQNKLIEQYHLTEEAIQKVQEAEEGMTRSEAIQYLVEQIEAAEEVSKRLTDLAKDLNITATELEGLRDRFDDITLENFLAQLAEAKQKISDYNTVIDNLQESLKVASEAQKEYSENGYLTLDTFQGLMSISAQYLTALINENGQLEINQTTLGNLVEKIKAAKIEELQAAETADILAYAQGDVAEMSSLAQTALDNAGLAAETAGQRAANGSTGFWELSDAIKAANDAAKGKETIVRSRGIEAIHNAYKDLANQISKVEVNTTRAGNAAVSAGNKGASAARQAKNATKDLNSELQKSKSNYDKVIQWISKQYDKQIESIRKAKDEALKAIDAEIKALEKEKDKALKNIEAQIKAVEKQKEARKKYWDAQIDALKKQNKEQKEAVELQEKLDALERAKNMRVKIYKEGEGFVYDTDQTEVAKAQKELDEYLSEQAYEKKLEEMEKLRDAEMENFEQRIQALNDYKDRVQESYEQQIADLQEYRESVEEEYDAQIEMYENLKKEFEDMVNQYEEQQTKLLFEQLTGIKTENGNWMTRLDNLRNFVNQYNSLLAQLGTADTSIGGGGGGGDRWGTTLQVMANHHASGAASISQDELAVVGENPNKEIVLGSKLNNGELLSLDKGSGVVNAKSTNTLAGMLNQIGQFGSSNFGSGKGTLNNNINNENLVINGVTIQGANIKDPETFVNGLLNLKAEALQRAYKHR